MIKHLHNIPRIGFGTWNRSIDEAYSAVRDALAIGYRHIDTAQAYQNELSVGQAIRDSGIPREQVFVTTKVDPVNYGYDKFVASVEQSLSDLQLDQVDLLLLHFPSLHDEYPPESYLQLLQLVQQMGMCKYIGVSNFTRGYLRTAIEILGKQNIFTNQVEIHVYLQNRPIVDYCAQHEISTTAYSPLARGQLLQDPVLKDIARLHECSSAQVALAFLLAEGHIVIPSSSNTRRALANFQALDIVLSNGELERIRALDRGLRLVDEDWCPKWDQ